MPKSKHRKGHLDRVNDYKARKKMAQEALKKEMIEKYMSMQKENLDKQEAHTSTEEVSGPEINIDDLSSVNDLTGIVEDIDIEITDDSIEFSEDQLNK